MRRVYFDNNATTPIDPRVIEVMAQTMRTVFGNPSSIHAVGREARRVVEEARESIAKLLGATDREITFTSCGTESNNLAVFGLARAARPERRAIVTSPIEHACVRSPIERLAREGFEVRTMPVTSSGIVDIDAAKKLLAKDVAFSTLIWAQNETGAVQPVAAWAELCREHDVPLHVDAVQAAGKLPIDMSANVIASLSISAHKFFGPKGAAALFLRAETPWRPTIIGGGQERERRAGTENTVAISGFGKAAQLAAEERDSRRQKTVELERRLLELLHDAWPEALLNTRDAQRVPGTLSLRFPGAHGESMLMNLDLAGIAVSLGSACSSGAVEASHVLRAMGLSLEENYASLRVSIASTNTMAEIEFFANTLRALRSKRMRA